MDTPIANDRAPWRSTLVPAPKGGAALGPRSRLVLPKQEAADLVVYNSTHLGSDPRKLKAWRRFLIYTEEYASLIIERLNEQHHDPETRARLASYVDLSINLALDITRDVAVVWKQQANRHIRDATDDQNAAFLELIAETGFASIAPAWNRQGWLLGPITALPVMRRGRMAFDTLLPHFYDVIQDPDDPWGNPLAACWDIAAPCTMGTAVLGNARPDASAVLVDGKAYHYYEIRQKEAEVARVDHDVDEWFAVETDTKVHSLGEFPGSTLRFDTTHGTSWWGCDRHQRLIDATIKIGCIDAKLGFVRKEQNKKIPVLKGDVDGAIKGQKHDPEIPVILDAKNPNLVDFDALDFDTSPENFITHAEWVIREVAHSYGAKKHDGGKDFVFSHEVLTEIRNEQIAFARAFENDLWAKVVAVAKANNHRLASRLPDPDNVREGFEVQYGRLSRVFATPSEEAAHQVHELTHGIIEHADLLSADYPHHTRDQRQEIVLQKIAGQGEVFEALAKRNQQSADKAGDPAVQSDDETDPKLQTAAQINGAEGPKVRDGATPEREEETTDE